MDLSLSESLGQELRFAKKNQLNQSYKTQVMIKTSLNSKQFESNFKLSKTCLSYFTG